MQSIANLQSKQGTTILSGCIESSVRRVINHRLKSPGIFWKARTAEAMLFLRATLLCKRSKNMIENLIRLNRSGAVLCH